MKLKFSPALPCFAAIVLGLSFNRSNAQTPATSDRATSVNIDQVIDYAIDREKKIVQTLARHTPLIETYLQHLESDEALGAVPTGDQYFLGKLDFRNGIRHTSLVSGPGVGSRMKGMFSRFFSLKYLPGGFAEMMFVDGKQFDRNIYNFEYVRREFIGEIRCYVFDVEPKSNVKRAAFRGRIWIEDQEFNLVRFNGTNVPSTPNDVYFHFDSWRENMGPGLWLPAYIYIEESDYTYLFGQRKLQFKGQTRIWGYNVENSRQDEFTSLTVESDRVRDNVAPEDAASPHDNLRSWERQAEDNILQRLEKASLLAPAGEVNKVLETVTTNIEITNKLNIQPPVRARVLLTSPLESFTIGHTIVLSRGLVDVLPDEASLAMILAHELAHIVLDHELDTRYAFNDRMLFRDDEILQRLSVKRNQKEEDAADIKAAELLKNSPYKDKLGNAGLFLRALDDRGKVLPNLLRSHLGDFMVRDSKVRRMADLINGAPALEMTKTEQIAALPLGGRVRVSPWDNTIVLLKAKPIELFTAREKMPFELTPIFLNLKRLKSTAAANQPSVKK